MRRILVRLRGAAKRGMFNAFLPRAPLWLHSTSLPPRGTHIRFLWSGTLGRPCWQTLDVWADVGLDSFSSRAPKTCSWAPPQVEGMGESWHRKGARLPLLVFLPTFVSGSLSYDKRLYSEPPFTLLHRLRVYVIGAVFFLGEAHL